MNAKGCSMSLAAYQKTLQQTDDPRSTEYRLLAAVTGRLIAAAEHGRRDRDLIDALSWNRQIWTALAADCADDGNRLPVEVRAQIISLSIWVSKHVSAVLREQAKIAPLIEVNRAIMQGLQPASPQVGAAPHAA